MIKDQFSKKTEDRPVDLTVQKSVRKISLMSFFPSIKSIKFLKAIFIFVFVFGFVVAVGFAMWQNYFSSSKAATGGNTTNSSTNLSIESSIVGSSPTLEGESWDNVIDQDIEGNDGTVTAERSVKYPYVTIKLPGSSLSTIHKINILTDTNIGNQRRWLKGFRFQLSKDGKSFVTAVGKSVPQQSGFHTFVLSGENTASHVKLILDSNYGDATYIQVGELEIWGTNSSSTQCTRDPWQDGGCGQGGCASDQMYQTRTVSPAGCDATSQCIAHTSCQKSKYTLTVNKTGSGSGTVTSNPAGISCGTDCSESYDQNTSVTLTAAAFSDARFIGWSGACSGTNTTCTVVMDQNKTVTAQFDSQSSQTPVNLSPRGVITSSSLAFEGEDWDNLIDSDIYDGDTPDAWNGTVTASKSSNVFAVIDLRGTYDISKIKLLTDTGVGLSSRWAKDFRIQVSNDAKMYSTVLTAVKKNTSGFQEYAISPSATASHVKLILDSNYGDATYIQVGELEIWGTNSSSTQCTRDPWQDGGCGQGGCASDQMYQTRTVSPAGCDATSQCIAHTSCQKSKYTLTVNKTGSGSGTVTSNPAGISCGTDCSESYDQNTSVTLTAAAFSDARFIGWSGACSGTNTTCTVVMDQNKTVTAQFDQAGACKPLERGMSGMSRVTIPTIPYQPFNQPFKDPVFGTVITRVTDASTFLSNNPSNDMARHEYATIQAFNADGTRTIIQTRNGSFFVYDLRTLTVGMHIPRSSDPEVQWHPTNPDIFYYRFGNEFRKVNISERTIVTLRTFSEYQRVSSGEEQSISNDGRYYALIGYVTEGTTQVPKDLFVYDVINNVVSQKVPAEGKNLNSADISPLANYALAIAEDGIRVYNFDKTTGALTFKSKFYREQHSDVTVDDNGKEVIIIDGAVLDSSTRDILKFDLSSDNPTPQVVLSNIGWLNSHHISCRNVDLPGWCLISTYDERQDDPILTREIFWLKIDGSGEVRRIAHHHSSRSAKSYFAEPHATSNLDGTKVIFASSWGNNDIEAYIIDLCSSGSGASDPGTDETPPEFISGGNPPSGFDVQPRSVSSGGPTVSWNVRDDTALSRGEVFRARFAVGECDGTRMSGCQWSMIQSITAPSNPWQGSWVDTTLNDQPDGDYWYGMHVFDHAGNERNEPSPVKVTRSGGVWPTEINLVASSVTASPLTVSVGSTVSLGGKITNTGNVSSGKNTNARYCYGVAKPDDCLTKASGTVIGTNTVPSLAPDESYNPSRTWRPASPGVYEIVLCADSDHAITESKESDNCTQTPVTVTVQ